MKFRRLIAEYLGMALVLVLLCAYFGAKSENFLTVGTFTTLANQFADALILAVGMTLVLIIAGIDLSVGSVLALCGAVLGVCLKDWGWPLPAAIGACLATGLACGAINGAVTVTWGIPSFVVTLGMMEIARGAAYWMTNSSTVYIGSDVEVVADATLFGFTAPFYVAIALVIVGQVILTGTAYGRHLLAVGANTEAARLSGLNPRWLKLSVFMAIGLMAAVAAIVYTARLGSADPNAGAGYELQAIAAVVIGGTSLMGGRGSVVSSFFGVFIIAVLAYGLSQIGAEEYTKRLITGSVVVVAVILDYYRHRLSTARGA